MMKIGFVGAGNIAQALARGFIAAGLTKGENIIASCAPQDTHCMKNFQNFGAKTTIDSTEVVKKSDVVILAVKPAIVPSVLTDITEHVTKKSLILSVAMGVSIQDIERQLPTGTRVVRVMPNTPALVREAASVFVCGSAATPEDLQLTYKLFQSVGTCDQVVESMLDPITALSGAGPAYVYVMIEALADGGVKMGLPRDLAYKLATQTVIGAGKMVMESKTHTAQLKDEVTSPGGCTISALHHLEKNSFRAALIGAVEVGTQRCQEMQFINSVQKS